MYNIIYTELMKLKRSLLLWLIPFSAMLSGLLSYASASNQVTHHGGFHWDTLVFGFFESITLLVSPILFSLFIGYIIAREFQDNTANNMFTYAFSRNQLLLGKYIIMIPVIFIISLLVFLFGLSAGLFVDHQPMAWDQFIGYCRDFGMQFLMSLSFVPLSASISMIWKSYIPVVIVGLLAIVSSSVILNSNTYNIIFPWTASIVMLRGYIHTTVPNAFSNIQEIHYAQGIISLTITFLTPLIFNFFYFKKMDVADL